MFKKLGYICFILMVFLFASVGDGFSQQKPQKPRIKFKAKRHFQDLTKNTIILEGEAVVNYFDSTLTAGNVTVERNSSMLRATDNVILTIPSEDTEIKAYKLIYDYDKRVGEFINAVVTSGYSKFKAERILKVGDKKYEMYRGSYSTCDVADDEACPWRIWSTKAKVTLDTYATAEHPVFYVGGVPSFYAPFVFFPVNRSRQSGFLMPEFGTSDSNGFSLWNGLYLALGRSHDATIEAEYLSSRGLKKGIEYRFKTTDKSYGDLKFFHLRDKKFLSGFDSKNRYALDYVHQIFFQKNLFNKADIKIIGDDDYVKDFEDDIDEGRRDAGLEAKIFQGWNFENITTSLDAVYYENLLSNNPKEANKDVSHKFPEFTLGVVPTEIFKNLANFQMTSSYVNFENEHVDFLDLNTNSVFDVDIDQLKRMQRVDVFPRISIPLRLRRYFEYTPTVGYRDTMWWAPVGKRYMKRRLLDFENSLNTTVGRIYNYGGDRILKMKHSIEPTFNYRYNVTLYKNNGLPRFDGLDQVDRVNLITLGLENRFIFKLKHGDEKFSYFDGIRFGMKQPLDMREFRADHGNRTPFAPMETIFQVNMDRLTFTNEALFPIHGGRHLENVTTHLEYKDPFFNSYILNHSYNIKDDTKIQSVNAEAIFRFIDILKFYLKANYTFNTDSFLEKIFKMTYFPNSKCWALNLVFEDAVDKGFSFNASVNILLGERLLSLAHLRQAGEMGRFVPLPEKGSRKDVYFEDDE